MRTLILFLMAIAIHLPMYACPVCERNKPKVLKYISTHGAGPESYWDYVIVLVVAIIAILSAFYSIKWLINPKEDNKDHIKYLFIKPEQDA